MPYTDSTPALPFSGKTTISRHCSHEAATSVSRTRAVKSANYMHWLQTIGRATDHAASEYFGWPLSSICSIRNGLVDRGLVTAIGICEGRYGKRVTIWGPA